MEILKEVPLFSGLSEEQLRKIREIALTKNYYKGEVIFNPGEKGEYFFILKSGKVKVFKTAKGKEQIIKVFDRPALFGEAASFTGKNFPAWAEAIENSEILIIPRKKFIHLIKEDPEIGMNLLSIMAQRLIHLTNVIESLSLKNALSKVSSYILRKCEETENLEIPFSTSMASMELGLTKETVSRMLGKLRKLGIIEKSKNKIRIRNKKALKDIALLG